MKRISTVLISVIIVLAALGSADAQTYDYITLDYPGASQTGAFGINDSGTIVGAYYPGTVRGFLLTGKTYNPLDCPDARWTYPRAINNGGTIVGYYAGGSKYGPFGFVLNEGTYTPLEHPAADNGTYAYGLNDKGTIVGCYVKGGKWHGFSLRGGTYVSVDYPGASETHALAVNNDDIIVGEYEKDGRWHGFSLSGGIYTSLDFPGAKNTLVYGINDSGTIVGSFSYVDAYPYHGFYLSGGNYTALDYPGAESTFIQNISNKGTMVGYYEYDRGGTRHGFTATSPSPIADANVDLIITKSDFAGGIVTLNGLKSSDPNGLTLTYQWYGPFSTTGGSTPIVAIQEGTYTISLVVDNGTSRSAVDTVKVQVVGSFPVEARAKAGKVSLTWVHDPNISRYDIYRATEAAPSDFVKIGSTTSSYSTYLDSTVTNENSYLYLVSAVYTNNVRFSNVVSIHPTALRTISNYAPVIYSKPVTNATTGIIYNYDVNASDPNNNPLTYNFLNAPSGMTIDPVTGLITWKPSAAGSFAIAVEVKDGYGGNARQNFSLLVENITAPNRPPVAEAGPDQTVYVKQIVTLEGSKSSDSDGDPLTYKWSFVSIPPGSNTALSNPNKVNPTFIADRQGPYIIQLIANDGKIDSVPDTVTVTANLQIVSVPNVVGMSQAEAQDAILAAKLTAGLVTTDYSNTMPAGNVISQDPPEGTLAAQETLVNLVVSLGPANRPPTINSTPIYTTLDYPGSGSTGASGINNAGTIVGYYMPGYQSYSFNGGTYTALHYPGSPDFLAFGINNDGTIVGYHGGGIGLSLSEGTWTVMSYPGSSGTILQDINDRGMIAGRVTLNGEHGFLLSGGVYTTLNYPGASTTYAFGINNEGIVVGYYINSAGLHGFSLRRGIYTTLDYPGATATRAFGINNAGTVVGFYTDKAGVEHGFSLRDGAYTTLDYPGATATQADAINDAGSIVGRYYTADGRYHGFMVTPVPEINIGQIYTHTVIASDPDAGDVLTYSLITAPSGMTINPTSGLVEWTPTLEQAGNYNITVRVTDSGGLSAEQSFSVRVELPASNRAPVANAGPDQTVFVAQTVTLDGSKSTDADGDLLSYLWSFTLRPSGSTATLSNATAVKPEFVADKPGNYVIQLSVNDGKGNSAPDTVTINSENSKPVANAGPDQSVLVTQTVTLDGSKSSDVDGDSLTYLWSFTSRPAGSTAALSDATALKPAFVVDKPGSYAVQLIVNDGKVNSSPATVTISTENSKPIANAGPDQTVFVAQTVILDGNESSDVDGDPLAYKWSFTAVPAGSSAALSNPSIVNPQFTADSVGVYVVQLIVNDGKIDSTPATVTITTNIQIIGVPNVVGMTQTAAQKAILAAKLSVGTVATAYSNTIPAGNVISQDPPAGTLVAQGSPVNLVVSLGPAPVIVVGMTKAAALEAITKAGLVVGTIETRYNDTIPAGNVISQDPPAGTYLPPGTIVNLTVSLGPANKPPTIVSTPLIAATEGVLYTYDVDATDSDGDSLTYSLTTAPTGMIIDPSTGLINWTPSAGQNGSQTITIQVDDGRGGIATQTFTLSVRSDTIAPVVTLLVQPQEINLGDPVAIRFTATDNVAVVSHALTINGVVVPLDANGFALYAIDRAGLYVLIAKARDAAGNEGSETKTLLVHDPSDQTVPTVSISTPARDTELTGPTKIMGTAIDQNLVHYVLEYSPIGKNAFTEFARGTTSVVNGELGTLDPSLMMNGLHEVRLTAVDTNNNQAFTTTVYRVTGNQKVGNFTLAFQDFSVPMTCMPINVTRVYDSRDKTKGDFGIGWQLGMQMVQVQETRTQGTGWVMDYIIEQGPYGLQIPTYYLYDTASHLVTVRLPDGRLEEFDPIPSPNKSAWTPAEWVDVNYTPRPGTVGGLKAEGATGLYAPYTGGTVDLMDMNTMGSWNPRIYTYTTPEGIAYTIDKIDGVKSVTCPSSETLTITANGIIHSDGKSLVFTRDGQGRVASISDPNGNTRIYAYNAQGDLVSTTDPEGNSTEHSYNTRHGLLEIKDPRGVTAIRNEYDESGRLISTTDPAGNKAQFIHDLTARRETVKDRLGNETVHEYDQRGNVLRTTDPLGGFTSYTYDAFDNQISKTDPLGRSWSNTYDLRRNKLSETDPLGRVTSYTYNAKNAVLTITDALGRVTTNTYNTHGDLASTQDPMGCKTTFAYPEGTFTYRPLVASKTDCMGNVTGYEYNGAGQVTRETNPLGQATTYTYDSNGNKLSETRTRATSGGTEMLVTLYEYDRNNRLVRTTFPDGSATRTVYNEIGKQVKTIDQLGRETGYEYDASGRLATTTFPDGAGESSQYDAEGRRTAAIDRSGRRTAFIYDALGRLVNTIYADGSGTSSAYDPAGQMISSTDARGNVTTNEFNAAGRRSKVTDALGHITTFAYDQVGNQLSMTDANGNSVQFTYDNNSRHTRTTYPDATFDSVSYDALGRMIAKTDQAGKITQFGYDPMGRLIKVTDALGQITVYTYDEFGNRLTQTDANGHTTRFEYDMLGRRTKRTLPLGMFETMQYNAAGNLLSKTDFNGRTTMYAYDAGNRLLSKVPDPSLSQPAVSFSYTATGQRSSMQDASGITTYTYDSRDRLLTKATPIGTLTYTYDAAGNLASINSSNIGGVSVDYAYDALNRLATVTDNRLAGGVTTYSYDNVGSLVGFHYPNGVEHRYTYNTLNRLTDLTVANGTGSLDRYTFTLGATGNRTSVAELSGRKVDYAYDGLYRLTGETVTGDPTGINGVIGYVYDPVGNRRQRTSTVAPISNQTFTYDANDRITTEIYDANGNTLDSSGKIYSYDFENRIVGMNGSTVTIAYDGDGNRVAKTVNGVTTLYLVDTLNPTGYSQVIEEIASGTVQRAYTWGLKLISQRQASGVSYYGFDGHGSVRLLTDATSVVTDTYAYDVFGNLTARTGTTPNEFLYIGQQYDANIVSYYLRARYYESTSGRFASADPIKGSRYAPITLHKYVYASNDPFNKLDPSGLFSLSELSVSTAIQGILTNIQSLRLFAAWQTFENMRGNYNTAMAAGHSVFALLSPKLTFSSSQTSMNLVSSSLTFETNGIYRDTKGKLPDWSLEVVWGIFGGSRRLEEWKLLLKYSFTQVGVDWTASGGWSSIAGFNGIPLYDENGFKFILNLSGNLTSRIDDIPFSFEFQAGMFKAETPEWKIGDLIDMFL